MAETKSKFEEKIEKLMKLCSEYKAKFMSTHKFTDMKLKDGTTVVRFPNDKMIKGDSVTVITEQGEEPLPDSAQDTPYILEDGTEFTIVNGMVDVIKEVTPEDPSKTPPAPKPAPTPNPAPNPDDKTPKRVIKSQVEEHVFSMEIDGIEPIKIDLSSMFKPYTDKIEALEKKNNELVTKFGEHEKLSLELSETIQMIAEAPGDESVLKKKTPEKKYEDMTELEKYRHDKAARK